MAYQQPYGAPAQGGYKPPQQQQQQQQQTYGAPQQYGGAAPPPQYGQPQQQQAYGQPQQQAYGQPQQPYGQQSYGVSQQAPPSQVPPPGADPQLWSWFVAVDADRSGECNPQEIQRALINGDWSPFSLETVQLMMTLFDRDGSGSISFQEFVSLWKYIEDWKRIFKQFDRDNSGTINRAELRQALSAFGFNVSDRVVDVVVKKFAKKGAVDITFDSFICGCVTVKNLSEAFQSYDQDRDGWVNMSHDMFLEIVIGTRA
ncbi:uncharacterized protein EV422DRAFT_525743 [Fimicolochytrium jonesii]|uniref:uncharacterized protein n=1 Tax=Fimicolochytrium jonesii TaxID=1396493 RepID=UPI0022FE58ED|nr:uncharacterized protein EV422DRAFT_525743 [Fimicolochytrium jonesii]KAI8822129.1 hypothetical protein EV422DRAFT_525743 [Fimicolochytrium jonesii]